MKGVLEIALACCLFTACHNKQNEFITKNVAFAEQQTAFMLKQTGEPTGKNYPRSVDDAGKFVTTNKYDWTSGFFPGSLWYLYELTNDTVWRSEAQKWTHSLEKLKTFTGHHDLGFMMYCSYGNANRLAPDPAYKDILIQSAESLSSRYSPVTKTIRSWNYRKAWNNSTEWFYPVIVDNMMNLEMLFAATKLSGDEKFYRIAVAHANSTMKHHIRDDYSTYHVVNFDPDTGEALHKATCQGYSDNSTWARGQAWMIYGFTMMYRETQDTTYLHVADKLADFYMKHLPEDLVPAWDFNIAQEGYTPEGSSYAVTFKEKLRDASAAAIVCSAFFELGDYIHDKNYHRTAIRMLQSLSSPDYRATLGENAGFLLMHSVGSIPHINEIDKPLVYADYYFLEAIVRYKNRLPFLKKQF